MKKTFNIYCDESCHLENDHKDFMLLGSVSSAYNQVKGHTERINAKNAEHHGLRFSISFFQLEDELAAKVYNIFEIENKCFFLINTDYE